MNTQIIKISGNNLHDSDYVKQFSSAVSRLPQPMIIVHGGGRMISELQDALGLETRKVDGLRITDTATLKVTEMAMSGQVNKLLVRALLAAGVNAIGMSGVDGAILQCRKRPHPGADLGFVGEIHTVNTTLLNQLLAQGLTLMLSPISLGDDGNAYNVNADDAASALATALDASLLTFVSNVPGVLADGRLLPTLSPDQTERLIASQVITDGMIPKVRAATRLIEAGVAQAKITDLRGLQTGSGTIFSRVGSSR